MGPFEIIAITLAFLFISTPFFLYGFLRFLRHRETMYLAERGIIRPFDTPRGNGNSSLRWGIILAALGIAMSCGLYPVGWMVDGRTFLGFGPWMLPGFIALSLGLGLVLIHRLTGKAADDGNPVGAATAGGRFGTTAPSATVPAAPSAPMAPAAEATGTAMVPPSGAQEPMEDGEFTD